ncbi:MAG: phosphotransferase [Nocardioidaceae bacterium]
MRETIRQTGRVDLRSAALHPLAGGYGGETFLLDVEGASSVVRVYARDPDRALIDASLLQLMRGLVPVPEVLEVRPAYDGNPAVLVSQRLPGERLDLAMPHLDPQQRILMGRQLGRILARPSGVAQLRFGMFADDDLRLSREALPAHDLTEWAHHFRDTGRLASWAPADWEGLLDILDQAESLLADALPERFVLVHSDFNPKNLLVDSDTLDVTGVLDWEFAHAGSPYADLGNLTRFERHADFVGAAVAGLLEQAPPLATDPLLLGRAADLWALVELAGSPRSNGVRRLAEGLLLAQAREARSTGVAVAGSSR